jgi:hypothetical protein
MWVLTIILSFFSSTFFNWQRTSSAATLDCAANAAGLCALASWLVAPPTLQLPASRSPYHLCSSPRAATTTPAQAALAPCRYHR